MKLASFIAQLPPEFRIVLADVGSAGGLHGRWAGLRPIVNGLLFEPREGGATRREGPDTIYPVGLGSEAGRATLNVTALANMSSTLEPDADEIGRYAKKPAHIEIVERVEMDVDTLDAVAKRENLRIDAIKLDTQGSELGILKGARDSLRRSAVIAEVEVSFFRRYRDQPLFCDVAAFMAEHGYEPLDLYRLKRYRWGNTSGVGNMRLGAGQRAGRLAYADAIFVLTERELLSRLADAAPSRAEHMVLAAMAALLAYGKPDLAARLFDLAGARVGEPWRSQLTGWLSRLGRQRRGLLHLAADYVARRV